MTTSTLHHQTWDTNEPLCPVDAERPNSPAAGSRSDVGAEAEGGQVQCRVRLGVLCRAARGCSHHATLRLWLGSLLPLPHPRTHGMHTPIGSPRPPGRGGSETA